MLLRDVREMKAAFKILERWGKATGMKENSTKREGLAMGSYRHINMPSNCGVKWAEEGEWVIALGVPIGNDLHVVHVVSHYSCVGARGRTAKGLKL